VFHEFQVLAANVYDSLFAGVGPTADLLDVNCTQWLGTACHAATINGVPIVQQHTTGGGVDGPATSYPTNFKDLSIAATTGTMTVSDKTGFSLASTGLDAIPVANPTGVADTFPKMLVALWRHFFKKADFTKASGAKKTYADNGTTVVTTQTCTDADGVQTQGPAT
jgi:hypothetical protein